MAAPPQALPQQQGPGEFTRMFATPAAPQPMNTAKPAAAHQAAPTRTVKKKTNYLPLIILGALLFIAILVILILALNK
jgi:disulfide bond formation protein DsbB